MPFMVVNLIMTGPILIYWQMGSFFWMWFQQNPFLSHFLVQFFSVGGLALTFRIWTLLEIIPRRKRSTMRKYKNINHFVRVYSINSTFHDTAMGVGQLYNGTMENRFGKKWFRLRTG